MHFSVDIASFIGAAHVRNGMVNQDYAYGKVIDKEYGVVSISDGCSTGGKTDIGARVQSLAVAQALSSSVDKKGFSHDIIVHDSQKIIRQVSAILNLSDDDLLATSLYGMASKNGAHVVVCGDGVVAMGFVDGSWRFIRVEWRTNMPFYPIYKSSGRIDQFVQAHGTEDAFAVWLEYIDVDADGSVCQWCERRSVAEGIDGLAFSFVDDDYKKVYAIGVFSDGIAECASPIQRVLWHDVMRQIVAFKNTSGVFLVRRMMRVLRDYRAQNIYPQDDISGAILLIDHDDEEVSDENE